MSRSFLQQALLILLGGTALGFAANQASPRPVALTIPVFPASAAITGVCTAPLGADAVPPTFAKVAISDAVQACEACTAGFVDARGSAAFAAGHISGALHISPVGHDEDEKALIEQLRTYPSVIVYDDQVGCELAEGVATRLQAAGLKDVRILKGNWADWEAAGGPAQSGQCGECGHGDHAP